MRMKRRSIGAISISPSAPCGSPSSVTAIPRAADFSTARKMPRRWAAWTFAASRCRIRPRRARIPSPRSFSTGSTLSPAKNSIATGRKKRSKLSSAWFRSMGCSPQLTASPRSCMPAIRCRSWSLGAAGDPKAKQLEKAANEIYRFGKAVLRVTPENLRDASLRAGAARNAAAPGRREAASTGVRRKPLATRPSPIPQKLEALLEVAVAATAVAP